MHCNPGISSGIQTTRKTSATGKQEEEEGIFVSFFLQPNERDWTVSYTYTDPTTTTTTVRLVKTSKVIRQVSLLICNQSCTCISSYLNYLLSCETKYEKNFNQFFCIILIPDDFSS